MNDDPKNLTEEPVLAGEADPQSTPPADDAAALAAPEEQAAEVESAEETAGAEVGAPEAATEVESDAESAEVEDEAAVEDEGEETLSQGIAPSSAETGEAETGESEEVAAKDWYILKVQSNREKSISEALQRRVSVEGLDEFFDEIIVPTEKVTEFKGGKKRVVRRKLYPGYILVHMHINDDTWFAVRETPGIGDFTGSGGKPTPMLPHEVKRIVSKQEEKTDEAPKLKINFKVGDRVKINEGTFGSFEGEVSSLDESSGRVVVMIDIFGRSTPVQLEYWQVETV